MNFHPKTGPDSLHLNKGIKSSPTTSFRFLSTVSGSENTEGLLSPSAVRNNGNGSVRSSVASNPGAVHDHHPDSIKPPLSFYQTLILFRASCETWRKERRPENSGFLSALDDV
jgi:hypothetical protein